jgi:hypothetical protein
MNCLGLKGKVTQSENAILSYFLICIFKTKGIDRLPEFFLSEELIFEFLLNLKAKIKKGKKCVYCKGPMQNRCLQIKINLAMFLFGRL